MSQVGSLYSASDRRRADAFQIYAASVNAGAFLAPLICGALGKAYGWHYGFGFAGFGIERASSCTCSEHGTCRPIRDPALPGCARASRHRNVASCACWRC